MITAQFNNSYERLNVTKNILTAVMCLSGQGQKAMCSSSLSFSVRGGGHRPDVLQKSQRRQGSLLYFPRPQSQVRGLEIKSSAIIPKTLVNSVHY